MSRLLSDATVDELIEALRARMPKTIAGNPVDLVQLHVAPDAPITSFVAHLRLPNGRTACGTACDSVARLTDGSCTWCVFENRDLVEGRCELVASGGLSVLSSHA